MAQLQIEAASPDLAWALMARLRGSAELQEDSGVCRVSVPLAGHHWRAVVETLDVVEAWLVEHELSDVRVSMDGHTYLLTPPLGALSLGKEVT